MSGAVDQAATQAAAQPSVDDLVSRLGQDPVVIDDRFGNGETALAKDGLEQIVAAADHPTYVVLAPAPSGLSGSDPAADLANQLHGALGDDDATFAVYLDRGDAPGVASVPTVVGFGDAPGDDEVFPVQMALGGSGGGINADVSTVGVLARDLQAAVEGEQMSGDEWDSYSTEQPWAERSDWEVAAEFPEPGSAALVTTLAAVVAAGLVLLLLARVPALVAAHRGRGPRSGTGASPGEPPAYRSPGRSIRDADAPTVRASLDATLDLLASEVAEHLGDVEDVEVVTLVTGSRDTARRVTDRVGHAHGDLPDLVGALVLARIARQALGDAWRDRAPRPPYRVCLIDPRHGEARAERELPVGERTLTVPVCADCRPRRAEKLRPLRVAPGRFGGARPYLETDSVWARTGYGAFTDELWRTVSDDLADELDGERS